MDEMNRDGMNRRDFAGLLAGLLAVAGGFSAKAEGQTAGTAAGAAAGAAQGAAGARSAGAMRELVSGVFKPQAGRGMQGGHESHSFMTGVVLLRNRGLSRDASG